MSKQAANTNNSVVKRLQQDLMTLMMESPKSISAFPVDTDNMMLWKGKITGPEKV